MKICFFLTYANPHITGWIDEFIQNSDHEVIVGAMNSVKNYRENYFGEADNKQGYIYLFKAEENVRNFFKILRGCDYLITLGIFEKLYLKALITSGPKKVIVVSEPFNPFNKRKLLFRNLYVRFIRAFKKSTQFSFLCVGGERVKKEYSSLGFNSSSFYEFGHFPKLQFAQKNRYNKNESIRLLFVGQLIYRKGIDTLIEAIKYLKGKYTNWHFTIVGDGILKDDLMQNLNGDPRITFIDNIEDRCTMNSLFNSCHILFLPSYFDGWGAVVNEALSSCCSLLLSKNVFAGKALLLEGKNGFSFNPYQKIAMLNAIDKYFYNPEILTDHFKYSAKVFAEWNHQNAANSFNMFISGLSNENNHRLLKKL